ncbi:hypothetical protein G6011_01707 [Alternaria panax]|uniref:R3H domain-containing protein n=1 Tax=Alternaria panax TaxID=48097 RepID=A0AAD4IKD6_9PLEO|nr:hypothetical protein G6011_01707 [Alternaria panax]
MSTPAVAPQPPAAGPSDASRGARRRRHARNRGGNANTATQPEHPEPTQAQPAQPSQRGGGRSGRGRGRGGQADSARPSQPNAAALEFVPSSVQEAAHRGARGGRGGGRAGRGRGGAERFPQRMAAGGRQFGGQLTGEDGPASAISEAQGGLQADAPTFQPGQPIVPRKSRPPRQKQPQAPKSTAPDIATRTHEDIDNGHYECAICTEDVTRRTKGVWSCRTCWTVFHLGCIKKWSTNEGSAAARQQTQDGETPPPRQWRCPGCNLPKDILPKNFHCWCEKELDPRSTPEEKPCSHKIFVTCECQRIKQEAKCNASRNGDGNLKKVLKCDEECARLERNRVLALALNVDPEHQNDHISYSDATLNMYQQNATWAVTQEKQLRLFAADPDQKRLRFKPMPRNLRKFIHYLAEDFGMDSESMDPEPHRHVAIFKTPKFVMAPMRTLADCARTRQVQQRLAPAPASVATSSAPLRPKPSNTNGDPYNAFIILNPRFALTIEELNPIIKSVLATTSFRCELEVAFLPSEAVALKPPLAARLSIPEHEMQKMLESIQAPLTQAVTTQGIGKNIQLARLDSSLNILRKESDVGPGSGWSQVAASKGVPLRQVQRTTGFGNKGGFAVLSLSSSRKKKQKEPVEEIAENWEEAEEEEEQKEKVSGANSAAVSDDEDLSKDVGEASSSKAAGGEDQGVSNDVLQASSTTPASDENLAPKDDATLSSKPLLGRWSDLDDELD